MKGVDPFTAGSPVGTRFPERASGFLLFGTQIFFTTGMGPHSADLAMSARLASSRTQVRERASDKS